MKLFLLLQILRLLKITLVHLTVNYAAKNLLYGEVNKTRPNKHIQ